MAINQLKAGAILSYVSIGLNNLVGLLYMPFMLRMMGQNEYGLYSLVASVITYLTVLDLGFGNAIVRYTAKFRAEGKINEQYDMFGMFLILYSIVGVITLLIGTGFYFNVDVLFDRAMTLEDLSKVRTMMLLMTVNLAFTFPISVFGSIIVAYEDFVFQKLVNITRIILNPLVMIAMLMLGYRAIGMTVITTLFNVVTLLVNCWYCFHKIHIRIYFGHFKWGFLKEVSIYSFWIFLNAIMDRIYWSSGQFILGMYKGAVAVAVYAVAIQLQGIYMSFSTAISGVFLPKVTAMVAKENNEKAISDLFIRMGRIQYAIMAFILTGFILFGKVFIYFWAGSDYDEAYYIALLFFIPLTIPLIQNLGIIILQARNQMRFRCVLYVVIAFVSLGISIPLARLYGGIGCALGTVFALVVGQIIAMNIYYHRRIHIDIVRFWKEIFRMSLVPILLGGVGYCFLNMITLTNAWELGLAILLFSLIYVPLFWYMGLNGYEQSLFREPLKRLLKI